MKIAFFTSNTHDNLTDMIISEFFAFGVTILKLDDPQEIIKTIAKQQFNCIFFDVDSKNLNWLKIVEFLKKHPKTSHIRLIAFTSSTNKKYIDDLVIKGANGIFHTSDPPLTSYVKKIEDILHSIEKEIFGNVKSNQRKFVRVTTGELDELSLTFEIPPHTGEFTGKVVDISVNSTAITLNNYDRLKMFIERKQQEIKNLTLKIDQIPFKAESGKIVRLEDAKKLIVVMFDQRNHKFDKGIVDFIFEKINY